MAENFFLVFESYYYIIIQCSVEVLKCFQIFWACFESIYFGKSRKWPQIVISHGTWQIVIIHSYSKLKKTVPFETLSIRQLELWEVIDWSAYEIPVVSPHKLIEIPLRAVSTSFDYQAFLFPIRWERNQIFVSSFIVSFLRELAFFS